MKAEGYCHVYQRPPLFLVLSRTNKFRTFTPYCIKNTFLLPYSLGVKFPRGLLPPIFPTITFCSGRPIFLISRSVPHVTSSHPSSQQNFIKIVYFADLYTDTFSTFLKLSPFHPLSLSEAQSFSCFLFRAKCSNSVMWKVLSLSVNSEFDACSYYANIKDYKDAASGSINIHVSHCLTFL